MVLGKKEEKPYFESVKAPITTLLQAPHVYQKHTYILYAQREGSLAGWMGMVRANEWERTIYRETETVREWEPKTTIHNAVVMPKTFKVCMLSKLSAFISMRGAPIKPSYTHSRKMFKCSFATSMKREKNGKTVLVPFFLWRASLFTAKIVLVTVIFGGCAKLLYIYCWMALNISIDSPHIMLHCVEEEKKTKNRSISNGPNS